MKYLLDTNILLAYLRHNDKTKIYIDQLYNPLGDNNYPIIRLLVSENWNPLLCKMIGENHVKIIYN